MAAGIPTVTRNPVPPHRAPSRKKYHHHSLPPPVNLRPRGGGGRGGGGGTRGGGGRKLSSRVHTSTCMKQRSENGLHVPKNGFQRAQKPAIWRPKRPPRHPKRHPETASRQTPRHPRFRGPKRDLPKTLLPWGLATPP